MQGKFLKESCTRTPPYSKCVYSKYRFKKSDFLAIPVFAEPDFSAAFKCCFRMQLCVKSCIQRVNISIKLVV